MLASATMEQFDHSSFKKYSVHHCVQEALNRYPFSVSERHKVTISTLEDFTFYGSDTLLIYVLFNLLKNALYALKAKGEGNIDISTYCSPSFFTLRITDTGTGIAEDVRPYIFEAFFTTKKGNGTGIGLAFCKRVLNSFNGNIRCESEVGRYTTFILEFPHQSFVATYKGN